MPSWNYNVQKVTKGYFFRGHCFGVPYGYTRALTNPFNGWRNKTNALKNNCYLPELLEDIPRNTYHRENGNIKNLS